jgi:DoxX-like family
MTKRDKIIYWIATIWMSFGMLSGGIAQLFKVKETIEGITHLGYPAYFLTIIGAWKILGVIAVLLPAGRQVFLNLLREWAYAGFFFLMTGAIYSHIACGDAAKENFGPALLVILIVVSWYFRPADRKIISANQ